MGAVSTVRIRADIDAHEQGLSSYGLVFFQMIRMFQALQAERWNEVNALRGEYERLRLMATGLGTREVSSHVRSAWAATREHWTGERIQQLARTLGQAFGPSAS